MIGGAILEGAGLALVAYDIWITTRRQGKLMQRDQLVQIGAAIEHDRAMGIPTVLGGAPPEEPPVPPVEERVAALEERLDRMSDELEKVPEEISRKMSDEIDHRVAELQREVFERFQDARVLLGSELGASLPLRVVGLALLVIGLAVATAGNVGSVVC
jgi:hypothetical protein